MEFRLTYRGELKGNGDPRHKHALRQHFHKQLAELWRQPPLVKRRILPAPVTVERPPFRFLPLVSNTLSSVAHLDILLLRPGAPGEILRGGADIDNRLKTLLDALKVPEANAVPPGAVPGPHEIPFFRLLEDDKLVVRLAVEADRLLDPANETEVNLFLHLTTRNTEATWQNVGL